MTFKYRLTNVCLNLFEDDTLTGRQFFPDLFISGRMKKEDTSPEDWVDHGDGAVHASILFILSQSSKDVTHKDEWHDDQNCTLVYPITFKTC